MRDGHACWLCVLVIFRRSVAIHRRGTVEGGSRSSGGGGPAPQIWHLALLFDNTRNCQLAKQHLERYDYFVIMLNFLFACVHFSDFVLLIQQPNSFANRENAAVVEASDSHCGVSGRQSSIEGLVRKTSAKASISEWGSCFALCVCGSAFWVLSFSCSSFISALTLPSCKLNSSFKLQVTLHFTCTVQLQKQQATSKRQESL